MSKFEERNPRLWAALERLSTLVLGSLLFLLFSAPLTAAALLFGLDGLVARAAGDAAANLLLMLLAIVTLPASLAGLLSAVRSLIHPVSADTFRRFWRTYLRSLWPGLRLGLLVLAAGLILWVDIQFFLGMGNTLGKVAAVAFGSVAIMAAMVNVYAWPLLAWYPQPLGRLLKRSFLLSAAHPFWAIAGLLGFLGVPLFLMLLPSFMGGLLLAVGPAAAATALGMAAWQAMKRYAGEDGADDADE